MDIIEVGIRDAKLHLSKLLKRVKQGEEVLLKDRGRPIAKIIPIETQELSLSERIQRLEEKGIIQSLEPKKLLKDLPAPLPLTDIDIQQLLQSDRENS